MNKLDTGAASFALAHANKISNGLRNIPPPILSIPAINPKTIPQIIALNNEKEIVESFSSGPHPTRRIIGKTNAIPNMRWNTFPGITILDPRKAKGIDVIKKGQHKFHLK